MLGQIRRHGFEHALWLTSANQARANGLPVEVRHRELSDSFLSLEVQGVYSLLSERPHVWVMPASSVFASENNTFCPATKTFQTEIGGVGNPAGYMERLRRQEGKAEVNVYSGWDLVTQQLKALEADLREKQAKQKLYAREGEREVLGAFVRLISGGDYTIKAAHLYFPFIRAAMRTWYLPDELRRQIDVRVNDTSMAGAEEAEGRLLQRIEDMSAEDRSRWIETAKARLQATSVGVEAEEVVRVQGIRQHNEHYHGGIRLSNPDVLHLVPGDRIDKAVKLIEAADADDKMKAFLRNQLVGYEGRPDDIVRLLELSPEAYANLRYPNMHNSDPAGCRSKAEASKLIEVANHGFYLGSFEDAGGVEVEDYMPRMFGGEGRFTTAAPAFRYKVG
jgi:hypothetical protein